MEVTLYIDPKMRYILVHTWVLTYLGVGAYQGHYPIVQCSN